MTTSTHRLLYLVAFLLITAAAFSRLLPHPMNFAPITALALFGGVYFEKRTALILPLAAIVASDYVLGFYQGIWYVYAAYLLIAVIGIAVSRRKSFATVMGGTLAGSLLFYILTNFGVWMVQISTYPKTIEGLISCYVAAIPFFRNSLAGDLFYVGVLFGSFELARKLVLNSAAARVTVTE